MKAVSVPGSANTARAMATTRASVCGMPRSSRGSSGVPGTVGHEAIATDVTPWAGSSVLEAALVYRVSRMWTVVPFEQSTST